MELADGLILAAFSDPADAILWALDLVEAMQGQVKGVCGQAGGRSVTDFGVV